jgi:hypothetical protein
MHQQLRDNPLFKITKNQLNDWSPSKTAKWPQLPQKWSDHIASWTQMKEKVAGFYLVHQELDYFDVYIKFCVHA